MEGLETGRAQFLAPDSSENIGSEVNEHRYAASGIGFEAFSG